MAPSAGQAPPGFTLRLVAQIPRLRRYATAWLHNAADADDLVQDCVERALRRQDSLQDPARLGGWLLAILHNLHLSNLRRARRRGPMLAVDSLADDLALAAPPEDRGEIRNFVRAMDSLSEDHRQILLLVEALWWPIEYGAARLGALAVASTPCTTRTCVPRPRRASAGP
jgi:RNA polymerase sigma-70 factor (ECF subfamily)